MMPSGKNGQKNAMNRLLMMRVNEGKTILPEISGPGSLSFETPINEPAGESRRFISSWIVCRQNFCMALFFLLLEVIFICIGVGFLGITLGPALCMIVFASIAIIVLSIEWWNTWIWRETSPMQISSNVYQSRVTETAGQIEHQQALLIPPGKSASKDPVKPVVHAMSPYNQTAKGLYSNGGGYKGRVAEKRRYDQPFMCNCILLSIIYIFSFFCLLVAIVYISRSLDNVKNEGINVDLSGNSTSTMLPTTFATILEASLSHSSTEISNDTSTNAQTTLSTDLNVIISTIDLQLTSENTPEITFRRRRREMEEENANQQEGISPKEEDEEFKSEENRKVNALTIIFAFVLLHFILVIIRFFVFLYQNKVCMRSLMQETSPEDETCEVPIVVRLQNYPPLPEIKDHVV